MRTGNVLIVEESTLVLLVSVVFVVGFGLGIFFAGVLS